MLTNFPCLLSTLVVMLPCAGLAQPQDRWHDSAGRPSPQPYPVPHWPIGEDPLRAHESGDATVIVLLTRDGYSFDRPTIEAWEDAAVQAWIAAHGRTFRANSQSPPQSVRAIVASPPDGVYAFRGGALLDHDRDFADAGQLLAWLTFADAGEVPLDFARKRAGERTDRSQLAPRLVLAQRLERRGLLEEAADEYTWVIEQAYTQLATEPPIDPRNPPQGPPARRVYLWELGQYDYWSKAKELGLRFPATRARLEALRDRVCALAADPGHEAAGRWALDLVSLVPDADRINALLDVLEKDPRYELLLARELPALVASLAFDGQWTVAGSIIRDPEKSITLHMSKLGIMEAMSDSPRPLNEASPKLHDQTEVMSAADAAVIYAALLAAGRIEEADRAAQAAFAIRDSPTIRAIFVTVCLDARQIRPEHRAWAEQGMKSWLFEPREDEPARPALTEIVEDALKGTYPPEP